MVQFNCVLIESTCPFLIDVYNIDSSNSQYIAGTFRIYTPLSTNGSFVGFSINVNIFSFQAKYRFGCANFYYGSRCEVFCQPHNDDINGHYTCDTLLFVILVIK